MTLLLSLSLAHASDVPAAAADLGKGLHIHIERDLDVSADEAWRVLAHEYAGIDSWATLVERSWPMTTDDVPEGSVAAAEAPVPGRWVTTGFGDVTETLVAYDDAGKTFTFRAGQLPRMIAYSQNTQRVVAVGEASSRVTFDIYMVPKGPAKLMKGKLERRFVEHLGHVIDEAEVYASTGEPSEAKQAMLAAAGR